MIAVYISATFLITPGLFPAISRPEPWSRKRVTREIAKSREPGGGGVAPPPGSTRRTCAHRSVLWGCLHIAPGPPRPSLAGACEAGPADSPRTSRHTAHMPAMIEMTAIAITA